jgi:glycosyltransferase involved in cell wall biosynthesis
MAEANGNKKEDLEGKKILELFKEEINKPYYKIEYLDHFKLPWNNLDVSIIIPTYNRAPYKPNSLKGELNPLAWAIKSAILQKPKINEIIIVDDFSCDKTKDVVDSFREEVKNNEIKLKYIKNKKNLGYSKSINEGVSLANSKYIFLIDDDSIVSPYATFGAVFTFEWIQKEGIKVGVLNLPPYSRTTFPEHLSKMSEIGQLDFSRGIFTSGKGNFPIEYLTQKDKFIPEDFQILKPFQIKNSGGYFITKKALFLEIGGFPETLSQRYMDTEFGSKMLEHGYNIYLSPDPKFACVHGSYGLKNGKKFDGDDWFRKSGGQISLKRAMDVCDIPGENTGCRIDIEKVLYSSLTSLFWMIYKRDAQSAVRWMKRVHKEFVLGGNGEILNVGYYACPREEIRKDIWNKAIRNSLNFIEKVEKQKLKKIKEMKTVMEKEKKISIDGLNTLFDF